MARRSDHSREQLADMAVAAATALAERDGLRGVTARGIAREIGYTHLRLDSARFMHAAHRLYCSAGFEEIDPYAESEIPEQFQSNWIFMEREL